MPENFQPWLEEFINVKENNLSYFLFVLHFLGSLHRFLLLVTSVLKAPCNCPFFRPPLPLLSAMQKHLSKLKDMTAAPCLMPTMLARKGGLGKARPQTFTLLVGKWALAERNT